MVAAQIAGAYACRAPKSQFKTWNTREKRKLIKKEKPEYLGKEKKGKKKKKKPDMGVEPIAFRSLFKSLTLYLQWGINSGWGRFRVSFLTD